jgi:hypothetical protein
LAQRKGARIVRIAAEIAGIFARAMENLQELDKGFLPSWNFAAHGEATYGKPAPVERIYRGTT